MTVTCNRAVRRFYLYRCAAATGFISPFLVAFLVANGISFTAVATGLIALSIVNIIGEVPAGYVGDRYGRRFSMLLASALSAVTATGWLFVRDVPGVVLLYAAMGASLSLRSGSDISWLYDVLEEHGEADRYSAVASRSISLMKLSTASTMLLGSALYVLSPMYAFIASAAAGWVGVVAAKLLPTNIQYRENGGSNDYIGPRGALSALTAFISMPETRTIVVFSAFFAGAVAVGSRYLQPVVDEAVTAEGVFLGETAIPGVVILGIVGATLTAVSAVAVNYSDPLGERLGTGKAVATVYSISALAMLIPLVTPIISLSQVLAAALAMLIFQSLPSVAAPLRNAYLHEYAGSMERATVMSAVTFAYSIVRIPIVLVAGVASDLFSAPLAVGGSGAFALLVGGLLVVVDGPLVVSDEEDRPSEDSDRSSA